MKKIVASLSTALLLLVSLQPYAAAEQYTVTLTNKTALPPGKFSLYAVGFSAANQMMLDAQGRFVHISGASGKISGHKIGGKAGELSTLTLDNASPFDGGLVLLVVVPAGRPAPYLTYTNGGATVVKPANPPSNQWPGSDQGRYMYQTLEITQPADKRPTINISVVDGFVMPVTITINPTARRPNGSLQVGQPLPRKGQRTAVTRTAIFKAYRRFFAREKISAALKKNYLKLMSDSGAISGKRTAILNPGLYIADGANPNSAFNTVWDDTLKTLFQTPGRKVGMIGDDQAYYRGTPTQVGGKWVLDFVGYTDSACTKPNANHYRIYSPLTRDPAGSYQSNESAGCMVLANDGVFADDSANVVLSGAASVAKALQRDIAAALNRGVALLGGTDGLHGSNSQYWGNERNWYPAGKTYNAFSRFMHTARIGTKNIFVLPPHAVKDGQGVKMGQSYGFAFDESPVHSIANQPNVPAKFDPVPANTKKIAVTIGSWK